MFKKKISKFLIALILLISCAFSAISCKKTDDDDGVVAPTKHTFTGTHDLTAPDSTTDYLVQNGQTDYTIVTSKDISSTLNMAKKEFVELFERATGARVGVATDEEVSTHTATGKYISIGENALTTSAQIPNYNKTELTQEGFRIYTKDKSIYILGGKDIGTLYGVYTFFEIYFNFDQYTRNCVTLDKVSSDTPVPLKLFNVKDIPDVKNHANSMGFLDGDSFMGADMYSGATEMDIANREYRWRANVRPNTICLPVHATYDKEWLKIQEANEITYDSLMAFFKNDSNNPVDYESWIPKVEKSGTRGFIHNTNELMPKEEISRWKPTSYGAWTSDNGPQFCYTAHGDEESLELFTDACALKIIASLYHYTPTAMPQHDAMPEAIGVYITVEDQSGTCSCEGCKDAYKRDNNSYAGAIVRFCNMVSRKVDAWMELKDGEGNKVNAPYARDDFQIVFFAYASYTDAPCKFDEDSQTWVPANDEVEMDEHVTVYCVPGIASSQYLYTQESDVNKKGLQRFEAWNAVSDRMWYWSYSVDFSAVSYPFNRLTGFNNEFFQLLASGNVNYYFDNGVSQGTATTAFYGLYWYVSCKLCWDSTRDMQTLINNWFKNVFLDAAPIMQAYYESTMAHDAYLVKYNSQGSDIGTTSIKNRRSTTSYPLGIVRDWLAMFDDAYKAIEKYKTTNYNLYLTLKDRIDGEYFSPLVIMLDIYCGKDMSFLENNERLEYIYRYKEIAAQPGGHDYKLDDGRPSSREYANELE